MKIGKCTNYNHCRLALNDKVFEVRSLKDTKCPECGRDLVITEKEEKSNTLFSTRNIIIFIFLILLLIIIFLLYKNISKKPSKNLTTSKKTFLETNITETNKTTSQNKPIGVEKSTSIGTSSKKDNNQSATSIVPPSKPKAKQKPQTLFKICGSNMINHEIMPTLVENFLKNQGYKDIKSLKGKNNIKVIQATKDNKEYKVEIKADGTKNGYRELRDNSCDIASSYGEMDITEAKRFSFNIKQEQYEDPFAFDAIAIVVNTQNNIEALTTDDLINIFNGTVRDWSNVKNSNLYGDITLYTMSRNSGIYHEFVHDLSRKRGNRYYDLQIASHREFSSHEDLERAVSENRNAIGFVSFEHITNNVKVLGLIEGEHIIFPSRGTIFSEEYDLYDELFIYTNRDSLQNKIVKNFRVFLDSYKTQEWLAKNTKLIPIEIVTDDEMRYEESEKQKILEQIDVKGEYREILKNLVKTPINFHFERGEHNMDHEGHIHIKQLNYLLKKHPEYKGKDIVLIGYSDSVGGDSKKNRELSLRRAIDVKNFIIRNNIIGHHKIDICGFGAYTPLLLEPHAHNEHETRIDRRVEVWIDKLGKFNPRRFRLCK